MRVNREKLKKVLEAVAHCTMQFLLDKGGMSNGYGTFLEGNLSTGEDVRFGLGHTDIDAKNGHFKLWNDLRNRLRQETRIGYIEEVMEIQVSRETSDGYCYTTEFAVGVCVSDAPWRQVSRMEDKCRELQPNLKALDRLYTDPVVYADAEVRQAVLAARDKVTGLFTRVVREEREETNEKAEETSE